MTTAQFKQTSVDLTGLLKVLGENLYSRPEVAIRELVQNASDAIARRRLEGDTEFEPRINVTCESAEKQLIIEDNGSGLTAGEIETFLARIGAGFTRNLRVDTKSAQLIGQFGLGFLTAYMIGEKVEVFTTPVGQPDEACHFVSENGERYIVSPMAPGKAGSRVVIGLREKFEYLAEPGRLYEVIEDYCRLMRTPIFLQGSPHAVNITPPWREITPEMPAARQIRLRNDFAKIIEPSFEPVCTIAVDNDEKGNGEGLLWVHDSSTYGGSDNRWMQIYVRGMMVARNKHDFLPAWAGFVSGIYESHTMSPTASREDLQEDVHFADAKDHVLKSLTRGLAAIAKNQPENWRVILRRHNEALLGAAIADPDLFDAIIMDVTLPTTEGDMRLGDILERSPDGLTITTQSDGGADEIVARAKGIPIILGYRYGAATICRIYAGRNNIDIIEMGTQIGNSRLFPAVAIEPNHDARLSELFGGGDMELRYADFDPPFLSCLVLIDKEQQLKSWFESDQADQKLGSGALALARAFTQKIEKEQIAKLVINMRSPLIRAILSAPDIKAGQAASILKASALMLGKGPALGEAGFAGALEAMNDGLQDLLGDANGG